MKFLKQAWSGRIYVKTDVLAQRKDMDPYVWPAPAPKAESSPELPEAFCKRVFGKHISKVTKVDILTHTGQDLDPKLSKPEMLDFLMASKEVNDVNV